MPKLTIKQHIHNYEKITRLLDDGFAIGPFRFGLDPIIGLLPVVGDALPTIFSVYLFAIALQAGATPGTLLRMALNILIDWLFGSIPIIGDIFDIFFKASSRNLRLLKKTVDTT
jgi:hypothetical protein